MRANPKWLLAFAVTLSLVACGNKDDAAPAAGTAPATAAKAEAKKDDGGLFGGVLGGDEAAPAEAPAPELGAFKIESVSLGTALDMDGNVTDAKTVFSPKDAIRASVLSTGEHAGLTLVAHWTTADGTVVAHTEQALVPTGPTVTTFSLQNAQPWPAGMYQLAVQVQGHTLQSRAFEIIEPAAAR